jgi:8-oxo-dGTP diphosphatase
MTEYVVGFLIENQKGYNYNVPMVALIKKTKPEWQKGFLNGIGGKIEAGEEPLIAMIREFQEETGASVLEWRRFADLILNDGKVYCYVAFQDGVKIKTITEEIVAYYPVSGVLKMLLQTIPNLPWLLGMALDADKVFATINYKRQA